jgi:hypothetical protein
MCVSCYSYLLGFPQRSEEVFINQNLGKYNLFWSALSLLFINMHCTENPSVSDLYIPRIGLPIWLQQNRQTDPGII